MTRLEKKFLHAGRPGFTLVEMLVVIAVIVLAMTLAIPAIRSLTGSHSLEAAENAISSYLGQVRAEAIGQQQIEGVLFLYDVPTDRVMLVPVQNAALPTDPAAVTYLNVIPNRDPFYLPNGIRLFTAKDSVPVVPGSPYVDAVPNYRYLGPNTYPIGADSTQMSTFPIGVILFSGDGKLLATQYGFRLRVGTARSQLGDLMYSGNPGNTTVPADWPNPAGTNYQKQYLASQISFALVDKDAYLGANPAFTDHDNPVGNAFALNTWLDTNASAIIVNRYDGTLMRSE